MKKLTVFAILLASPAAAHPGHLGGLGGHDHWVAGIAIGAAVGVSIWGILKERRKKAGKHGLARKAGSDKAGGNKGRAGKGKQKPQEA